MFLLSALVRYGGILSFTIVTKFLEISPTFLRAKENIEVGTVAVILFVTSIEIFDSLKFLEYSEIMRHCSTQRVISSSRFIASNYFRQ